jgi:hypothetical protein
MNAIGAGYSSALQGLAKATALMASGLALRRTPGEQGGAGFRLRRCMFGTAFANAI